MRWTWTLANACMALVATGACAAQSPAPLRVCMAENNAPFSHQARRAPMEGFDVAIAQAIAARLQRPLEIVPFESELEDESTLSQEVNALLSSDVCDLASGFAMLQQDLGPATRATARTPEYPGSKPYKQRPWITLGTLIPSAPYHAVAMTLVVKDPGLSNLTLGNLGEARIGALAGTVAGAATVLFDGGRWQNRVHHLSRDDDPFQVINAGEVDTLLVSQSRLDNFKRSHPDTSMRSTGYLHPLRLNLGFVGLATNKPLLTAVSTEIQAAAADGRMAAWAKDTGVTWLAPHEPLVSQGPMLAQLRMVTE
jgi:ABC-type amino acid transport substrate-binding protein